MSSIQSFLRQRNLATSLLQAPTNNCYYVFVPTQGNYVGNYPPGYVQLAAVNPTNVAGPQAGFFREVQLITPVPAVAPTGSTTFGVGINSLGAGNLPSAGNAGDAGYGTYYIPIVVDGSLATEDGSTVATLPTTYLPLGGQL